MKEFKIIIGLILVFYLFKKNIYLLDAQTPGPAPGPTPGPAENSPVFEFGKPEIFVSTDSQSFQPYKLINKYKRTFMQDEYVIFAKGITSFKSFLMLYDPDAADIVQQNLGKEQYWAFINSTGSLPSLTTSNSTFSATVSFHTEPGNEISFFAQYYKTFISTETTPPYDMVFEIPGQSRTFRATKTAVDYQSWGLIRWQLSDKGFVTWKEIEDEVEALKPRYNKSDPTKADWKVNFADFQRIDNPCLPDIFLFYLIVGNKDYPSHQVYADIPAFHLEEDVPNFYNLTGCFCPHEQLKSHEECGHVQQIVLTNDHLVGLTDKGLYVSSSLNRSNKDVSSVYEEKPLISYDLIDPCAKFSDYISCFKQGVTSLSSELIHSIRLFYTPVCNLFQFPFYEDRLLFVVEHTTTNNTDVNSPPVRAITVLYASTPYKDWKALFIGLAKYNDTDIISLIGVFFNHQLRHFDVTLKVVGEDLKTYHFRRFILPDVIEEESMKEKNGYSKLDGFQGNGFLEKKFPGTFQLNEVFVNPNNMDVLFVGNQLWIAESGLSLVYTSLAGLSDHTTIRRCSFNHPDRTYVCVNSNNTKLIVGRVGSQYSPNLVDVKSIEEVWEASGIRGAYWTPTYATDVINNCFYTAAFSGNILLWYLFDGRKLKETQRNFMKGLGSTNDCAKYASEGHNQLVQSCNQLKLRYDSSPEWFDDPPPTKRGPYFRMISINPIKFKPIKEPTAGPLVPMLVDASTVILYEAKLPGDDVEHIYFSDVHIGQQIECLRGIPGKLNCKIFIRHIKPVDKYLFGFRQVLYGTILNPIPFHPLNAQVVVLQLAETNSVFVRIVDDHNFVPKPAQSEVYYLVHRWTDFSSTTCDKYEEKHIGQTHYFPGKFSILLQGFPDPGDKSIMWGYSTIHVRKQHLSDVLLPYSTFLADLSTRLYREKRLGIPPALGADVKEWKNYKLDLEEEQKNEENRQKQIQEAKDDIQKKYESNPFASTPKVKLFTMDKAKIVEKFDPIALIKKVAPKPPPPGRKKREVNNETNDHEFNEIPNPNHLLFKRAPPVKQNTKNDSDPWTVSEGGCHHILQLMPNPVLVGSGGRISLDLHDAISFTVKLRPLTELGRLMLYRPLFIVTNSNPDILNVEKKFNNDKTENLQSMDIMLSPSGSKMGVSSLVIRSIMSSLSCDSTPSLSYIVQIHRAEGRRLHVNYPIPVCSLPSKFGGYQRPWKEDKSYCTPYQDILKVANSPSDYILKKGTLTIFTKLAPNYRPPSVRGEVIPLSKFTYNVDPSKPRYNNWYHITNDSMQLHKCNFRKNKAECLCTDADKLSDHEGFTDCKIMVYTVTRAKSINISLEYDPIMKNSDQHKEFFSPKDHLSVYIEEINNREEFTLMSVPNPILDAINGDKNLNEGRKFYNAKNITVTLHGTGLYHFKAGVGKFDSFQEVSGYFILYSDSNELNHIKLVVVMLLTITFCFSLIFFGFIRVRRRLSSQLPFQSRTRSKFKLE